MIIKYKLRKQLSSLPCRLILGCIGHSRELSPEINPVFISAIKDEFGKIEEILTTQDFPNPPESYFREMGEQPLATTMIILEQRGTYTDLHHLKKKANRIEDQFSNSSNGRTFNLNPGAVGTYGICLASHKPTGGRWDISMYAFGPRPQLFFGGPTTYYERVSRWKDSKLKLISKENKFPEYTEANRIARFEELVLTLPKNDTSVELMADKNI